MQPSWLLFYLGYFTGFAVLENLILQKFPKKLYPFSIYLVYFEVCSIIIVHHCSALHWHTRVCYKIYHTLKLMFGEMETYMAHVYYGLNCPGRIFLQKYFEQSRVCDWCDKKFYEIKKFSRITCWAI